jgi:hypothetical protein
VENQIKLDALEQVFEKTNPAVHELYLAEIKMLRDQKAITLNHTFAATLKEKLSAWGLMPSVSSGCEMKT